MPEALVVEDNPLNMELLEAMLATQGIGVLKAENVEEAQAILAETTPDLIFLDVQLPGLDGLTFVKELRAQKGRDLPPIIAVTAHAMLGDGEKFLEAGFDYYLPKPINLDSLIQLLQEIKGV